jgi:hypothetical protein
LLCLGQASISENRCSEILLAFTCNIDRLPSFTLRPLIWFLGAPMRRIRTLISLFVPVLFIGLMWPQAQPKLAPSPTPQAAAPATTSGPCSADYYRNSNGVCVHRPMKRQDSGVPQGATAQCRDGSYSFSQHRSGTCSHHGGVSKRIAL